MLTLARKTLLVLLLVAASAVPAFPESPKCTECGMNLDPGSKFTSRITEGSNILSFCDIGDLFAYYKKHEQESGRIEVRDYGTGEWIDAKKAFYVSDPDRFKTPMGWGIAGFRKKNEAEAYGRVNDFTTAVKGAP